MLISTHVLFCLATATTCNLTGKLLCAQVLVCATAQPLLILLFPEILSTYSTTPIPVAYNNSPTTGPGCFDGGGDTLSCPADVSLLDNDTGSTELDTSRVFAWDREVSIVFTFPAISRTKVRQVNLFFYNIPSSGIGLPPAELFWSNNNPTIPEILLSHVIVGNQDLSQDDTTLRNVSLVVTTDQDSIADYRFFRIRFTFPAETSLIDWILLSEVQLCGEAGMLESVFL